MPEQKKMRQVKIGGVSIGGGEAKAAKPKVGLKKRKARADEPVTPENVRAKEFTKRGLNGVDEKEVREFLGSVADALESGGGGSADAEELNKRISELERENADLKSAQGADGGDERIAETLKMAQRLAEEVKTKAEHEAKGVVDEAKAKAHDIVKESQESLSGLKDDIDRLKHSKERFIMEMLDLLDKYGDLLKAYKAS